MVLRFDEVLDHLHTIWSSEWVEDERSAVPRGCRLIREAVSGRTPAPYPGKDARVRGRLKITEQAEDRERIETVLIDGLRGGATVLDWMWTAEQVIEAVVISGDPDRRPAGALILEIEVDDATDPKTLTGEAVMLTADDPEILIITDEIERVTTATGLRETIDELIACRDEIAAHQLWEEIKERTGGTPQIRFAALCGALAEPPEHHPALQHPDHQGEDATARTASAWYSLLLAASGNDPERLLRAARDTPAEAFVEWAPSALRALWTHGVDHHTRAEVERRMGVREIPEELLGAGWRRAAGIAGVVDDPDRSSGRLERRRLTIAEQITDLALAAGMIRVLAERNGGIDPVRVADIISRGVEIHPSGAHHRRP